MAPSPFALEFCSFYSRNHLFFVRIDKTRNIRLKNPTPYRLRHEGTMSKQIPVLKKALEVILPLFFSFLSFKNIQKLSIRE